MSTPIEKYAVIGDSRTCALIDPRGSVDWLCLPDLDSDACMSALLGRREHGRWLLTVPDATRVERRYSSDSFVLETTYTSPGGVARVTECMPLADDRNDFVRRVECLSGDVTLRHELIVRFGYGTIVPWAHRGKDPDGVPVLQMTAGPESLTLHAPHLPIGRHHRHEDDLALRAGQTADFTLTWSPSWEPVPRQRDVDETLSTTRYQWRSWAGQCQYEDEHDEAVRRSLLVLRLLTNAQTGGIAAAATTSLPESFGGVRNWDYRFCWLRDSALTLEALLDYGYADEARDWRAWLLRAVAGDPHDLQIMYRLDGGRRMDERLLNHLPGYADSRPVRVGNAAAVQVQHDVLGYVMSALARARDAGIPETRESWSLQVHLVNHLLTRWREPDHGIWEIRGPKQHFTQSKVMCWTAVDRALQGIERHGLRGPADAWRAARDEIHADVLAHGVDASTGSFVQHYGTRDVDASLLTLLPAGFLPPEDPRIVATVLRVRDELAIGPHVKRYHTGTGIDGLPEGEHPFLACSFWLVDALARIGHGDDARRRMAALVSVRNRFGLLAEEFDPGRGRFAGNYPQAFSHLGLVRAAHTVARLAPIIP